MSRSTLLKLFSISRTKSRLLPMCLPQIKRSFSKVKWWRIMRILESPRSLMAVLCIWFKPSKQTPAIITVEILDQTRARATTTITPKGIINLTATAAFLHLCLAVGLASLIKLASALKAITRTILWPRWWDPHSSSNKCKTFSATLKWWRIWSKTTLNWDKCMNKTLKCLALWEILAWDLCSQILM